MKLRKRHNGSTEAPTPKQSWHILHTEDELKEAAQRASEFEKRTANLLLRRSRHYRTLAEVRADQVDTGGMPSGTVAYIHAMPEAEEMGSLTPSPIRSPRASEGYPAYGSKRPRTVTSATRGKASRRGLGASPFRHDPCPTRARPTKGVM